MPFFFQHPLFTFVCYLTFFHHDIWIDAGLVDLTSACPKALFGNPRVVASNSIDSKAVQAMTDARVSIAQPPVYIQDVMDDLKVLYLALVPHTARAALLEHVAAIQDMNQTACLAMLEYVLSSGDLTCVLDLPITPLVNRQLVSLEKATSNRNRYTLLDAAAQSSVVEYDEPRNAKSFRQERPGVLNVAHLAPEPVLQYLKKSASGLDFSPSRQISSVNEVIILWLSKFWNWVGHWTEHKDALVPMISGFYLLPSRTMQLASMEEGIFVPDDVEPYLVSIDTTSFTRGKVLLPNGRYLLVDSSTLHGGELLFVAAFESSSLDLGGPVGDFWVEGSQHIGSGHIHVVCHFDPGGCFWCRSGAEGSSCLPGEDLPLRLTSVDVEFPWRQLDRLRFIPREPIRQRGMRIEEYSFYTKSLPPVVAPCEILLPEYEAIAWTQRRLLPLSEFCSPIPPFGKPTTGEVPFTDRTSPSPEVARDHTGVAMFSVISRVDVWLWNCADEMFLNFTDGGDLKAVRKFLQPYKDLLYVSGVEEIMNPPAPETEFTSVEAQYAPLSKGYAENNEERFPAHRSFLAPMSEYLKDLFCGDFTEAGPESSAEPIEGVSPNFGDIGLSVLLDILDRPHRFINPATYRDILQRATILDDKFLSDACEYYERENRDAIERLKGGTRPPPKNPRHIPQKARSTWNAGESTTGCSAARPAQGDTIDHSANTRRSPRAESRVRWSSYLMKPPLEFLPQ
ncbi:hypothetical protein BDZ89DRAFT_1185754 [Hymenopellis radicata]|nr:hypothetical protein BDZ89DRAFT_1185754 [Hymenopellis radicata]